MPSLPLPKGKPIDVPRTVHQALELHHQAVSYTHLTLPTILRV